MVASVALEDLFQNTIFLFRNRLSSNLSRQWLAFQPWFLVVPTHKPCMRKFHSADWIEDPQKSAGMMSHNLMRMYGLPKIDELNKSQLWMRVCLSRLYLRCYEY